MIVKHLNQVELSRRWSLSPRTLERWRWLNQGPRYIKVGGRVIYRLEDIETYESENMFEASADDSGGRDGAKQASLPPQINKT